MREKKVCGQISTDLHGKLEEIVKTYSTSIAELVTWSVGRAVADIERDASLGWELPADPRTKRAQSNSPSVA
jgi:hypothetical protein